MAGAGKSAISRRVAQRFELECADIDAMVSERCGGMSISDVFADIGEPAFRDLEAQALADAVAAPTTRVIATGGGIIERDTNRELLASTCRVVWLSASDEVLSARLHASSVRRPLLEGDLDANLRRLRERREHLYRDLADLTVTVGFLDLSATAEIVMQALVDQWPDLEDPAS